MHILLLLFIVLPIVEIYVLLTAGSMFGALPVIFGVVATAVIGSVIIRWQGLQALRNLQASMSEGTVPVEPVVDGVFLLIAAPFLMTPGFITDTFGFLLLVPPVRHAIAKIFLRHLRKNIDSGKTTFTFRQF